MNFSETYRSMNTPITPSPALVEKTLKRTRRRPLPLRRLAAFAAAAAVLLAVPALAVRTNLGYEMLYALAPAAAQFFQPVRLSAEDSGVTMEVLSVRVDGAAAQAYISLSGDAVDGTCDLFDSYSFHLPFDQTSHCERVGYDEESRTALFLCTTETMDGSPIPTGGKMTFSVGCFLSGKVHEENAEVALNLADFSREAETVPSGYGADYSCSGGSYSDERSQALWEDSPMLRPGKALAEPLPGLTVTAAGYADGLFHIQLCRGNAAELDNHGWLWLEDGDGTQMTSVYSKGFSNFAGDGTRVDYDQYTFEVSPEDLGNCTLHGNLTVSSALTQGRWQVTFPLETTGGDLTAVENGHSTGSFDLQDTLLTFAARLEAETGRAVRWEDGFDYRLFSGSGGALAEFACPDGGALQIRLDLVPYEETTGLWQVRSYSWSE